MPSIEQLSVYHRSSDSAQKMEDQFGNHVIQKLFEVCSEAQMTQLILSLIHNQRRLLGLCFHPVGYVHGVFVLIQTPNQWFGLISFNYSFHRTRAMQKMIEHIKTPEQRLLLAPVLIRRTVILSRNQNGYHVIQKCMEHFPFDDIKVTHTHILYIYALSLLHRSDCKLSIFLHNIEFIWTWSYARFHTLKYILIFSVLIMRYGMNTPMDKVVF